jgi:hypothetical protein
VFHGNFTSNGRMRVHHVNVRRSTMVKLTLLPLLATAAMASSAAADPPPSSGYGPGAGAPMPPGMTDPSLSPPGMTQPVMDRDCRDPDPARRPPGCDSSHFSGTFRGGFGHYFGTSGGSGG